MSLDVIFERATNSQSMSLVLEKVRSDNSLHVTEVSNPAQPFLIAWLARHWQKPLLVITDGTKTQEALFTDLESYTDRQRNPLLFFPAWEHLPHEQIAPHVDIVAERLAVISRLSALHEVKKGNENSRSSEVPIIVTSIQALMQKTYSKAGLSRNARELKTGDRVNPHELLKEMQDLGYEVEYQVQSRGQAALRGGIFDIFPPDVKEPVRMEFFGDELESIRHFDPVEQTSTGKVSEVILSPAGELQWLKHQPESTESLVDYLADHALCVLVEPDSLASHAEDYVRQVPVGDPLFISWSMLQEQMLSTRQARMVSLFSLVPAEILNGTHMPIRLDSLEIFRPVSTRFVDRTLAEMHRKAFFDRIEEWTLQEYQIHLFCHNQGEQQRLEEILKDYRMDDLPLHKHLGSINRGFICEEAKLVVVSDAEIFGRYRVSRSRREKVAAERSRKTRPIIDFSELAEGDYVVHQLHGIGRYLGVQQLELQGGARKEVLAIEYADSAKLYVPVDEAHLVSKYIGVGKAHPGLNALGGNRWAKTRKTAEKAVMDLAAELLKVQSAREAQEGFAYPPDTNWQREFEASFIYETTPDQQKAIDEARRDLEARRPMDRLICGDVGYGKTEVAIRAAFKVVMAGKQVAVLVPTTILAHQHFKTFTERMADYPVRIGLLSRFCSRREQQSIVEKARAGEIDIVIGTHRLVQPDVTFKDLGLVVIDEEQRFGVLHKERLKKLRALVDVLTLSATPIPRTLYLSLAGMRDMSVIETPPQDRLPVETIIAPYDERLIRDAIQREINREGQVYFLHNRVADIDSVRDRIKSLVPHARVAVGHGQMEADELEEVMHQFLEGETDVLVCTTIIESGLDIPNVNTIIIDRADRFGLSSLYQLRGRVGRWKHQAYAYLLLPRHAGLFSDARKRIGAIRQYSSLGSGFKIAMRDLEIRGAGNILGAEQSGHIAAIGFELYCQLLKQTVSKMKGEKVEELPMVSLKFDFLAMVLAVETEDKEVATIPYGYIADAALRIEAYRNLNRCSTPEALKNLKQQWQDRFGKVPAPVELLLLATEVKILAAKLGAESIETRGEKLMIQRNGDFMTFASKFPRIRGKSARQKLVEIRRILQELLNAEGAKGKR